MDERRRHHQELARDVEVEFLHQLEVVEVLLRDERDRDVVDVHLVLLDEVEQQVERPLEILQADRIVLEDRFEFELGFHQYFNFTAVRTRSMVSGADLTRLARPAISMSRRSPGRASASARRARESDRAAR